jgi:hypothetical protein
LLEISLFHIFCVSSAETTDKRMPSWKWKSLKK